MRKEGKPFDLRLCCSRSYFSLKAKIFSPVIQNNTLGTNDTTRFLYTGEREFRKIPDKISIYFKSGVKFDLAKNKK